MHEYLVMYLIPWRARLAAWWCRHVAVLHADDVQGCSTGGVEFCGGLTAVDHDISSSGREED
jgi:hypothetical protein